MYVRGITLQAVAIAFMFLRSLRGSTILPSPNLPNWISVVGWTALILALSAQLRIYLPKVAERLMGHEPGLITTGLFRFTRHPMYNFLFIWDIAMNVAYHPVTFPRVLYACLFYLSMAAAGYYHEQEVLLRFGQEAVDYYNRTPRLIFLYPFKRRG